ncbi:hypothetical protein HNP46_000430 [Pseudomonas nitritireducens]|uniref:Uncharacterized protein n=1 Tax=Pseudomonas nitroreducens TaxID=46680 RepID=A0A7W7NZH9_PSENT|nr:hypothetical protein [Pseudomonas nitritireducens]MBB4861619.1 hypothetical protein [Pseudomonas nitritireducens]
MTEKTPATNKPSVATSPFEMVVGAFLVTFIILCLGEMLKISLNGKDTAKHREAAEDIQMIRAADTRAPSLPKQWDNGVAIKLQEGRLVAYAVTEPGCEIMGVILAPAYEDTRIDGNQVKDFKDIEAACGDVRPIHVVSIPGNPA